MTARVPMLGFLEFADRFGVEMFPWQREAFGAACERVDGRFRYRLAGVSVARGQGKSFAASVVALWTLVTRRRADVLSVALDYDGAKVALDHARAVIRAHPVLARGIETRADGLSVPSTGSRWTVKSAEHTSSRGRHPDLVLYDEVGWARDAELFSSLLAGQASVDDPLMLVVSTVGRRQSGPLWTVKALADGGDPGVLWWWSGENLSPKVTADFLERQRRILVPAQFAWEHGNVWVDAADSFVTAEQVDRAMAGGWLERMDGELGRVHHAYLDVGLVHDPSVIAVGHEESGTVFVDTIRTFQGTKAAPVQVETLEAALLELAGRFELARIRVESWQGMATVQRLARLGLPVEVFQPSPKSLGEEWPTLAQRLAAGTLELFPHARLREELLNLTVEVGPAGAKVIDKGRVHQDHAVAVRGVCASLGHACVGEAWGAHLSATPTRRVIDGETREPYWPSATGFDADPLHDRDYDDLRSEFRCNGW